MGLDGYLLALCVFGCCCAWWIPKDVDLVDYFYRKLLEHRPEYGPNILVLECDHLEREKKAKGKGKGRSGHWGTHWTVMQELWSNQQILGQLRLFPPNIK